MTGYLQVAEEEGDEPIELPAEDDGTLLLSTLVAQFPGTSGLKFKTENKTTRGVRLVDGRLHPPEDGWGSTIYYCVFPKEEDCKKKWKYIRDYYMKRKRENKLPTGSTASARKDASIIHRLSFLEDTSEKFPMVEIVSEPNKNNEDDSTIDDDAIEELIHVKEETDNDFEGTSITQMSVSETFESHIPVEMVSSLRANSASRKPIASLKKRPSRKRSAPRDKAIVESQKQSKERLNFQNAPQQTTSYHIDEFFKGISASIKSLPPLLQLEAKRDISNLVVNLEFRALQHQSSPPSVSATFSDSGLSPYSSSVSVTSP